MVRSAPHRDLLLADLALVNGVAPARDVALALQRFWERREEPGAALLDELRQIARLSEEDCARLEEEADQAVAEAGDARTALGVRGGIDRSIHLELSVVEAPLVQALTEVGAGALWI